MIKIFFCILLFSLSINAAPTVSNIKAAVIGDVSALVTFSTSTPSHCFVQYGLSAPSYGSSTIDDTIRFYKQHYAFLVLLNANTLYHYKVTCTDANGAASSSDQTFTTRSASSSAFQIPFEVDSRMPNMSGAVERTVKLSGGHYTPAQFQTALNDAGIANEKRIITIDAGLTLISSYIMPANTDGNWIIIRSSQHASLPEGKRVLPSNVASMAKITNTNVDPPIRFAAGSRNIRFIGIEVTIESSAMADAPAGPSQSGLIDMHGNIAGSAANLARSIIFDRMYIHGLSTKNNRRGIYLEGEDIAVIDSYFDEIHDANGDAQAILAATVKRHKILNNTIISSGENYMWGGTGLAVAGYVVGDLEYARNHMYFPISWKNNGPSFAGINWSKKNLFEIKTGARVFYFGNYLGGTTDSQGGYWPDAQSMMINIKLEQNIDGVAACELMQDIIILNNFAKNTHSGVAVVGRTTPALGCTNRPTRVLIENNLFEIDHVTWSPATGAASGNYNGMPFFLGGTDHQQVIHNTFTQVSQTSGCNAIFGDGADGALLLLGDADSGLPGFIFKDNVMDYRGCGVFKSGTSGANNALNASYSGFIFAPNGIMRIGGTPSNFPINNIFNTNYTDHFLNYNNGREGNYRLKGSSNWKNAASDGTDLGADITSVEESVENSITGDWSSGSSGIRKCNWSSNPTCN